MRQNERNDKKSGQYKANKHGEHTESRVLINNRIKNNILNMTESLPKSERTNGKNMIREHLTELKYNKIRIRWSKSLILPSQENERSVS